MLTVLGLLFAGPNSSLSASCGGAAPYTVPQPGEPTAPYPDCAIVMHDDGARDANDPHAADPDASTLAYRGASLHAVLAPIAAGDVADARGGGSSRYYLFVERDDKWFRSPALFGTNYNERYCSGAVDVAWSERTTSAGHALVAHIAASETCLTCAKLGDETRTLDLLVVVGLDGASPELFGPIVVGEHTAQEPSGMGEPDAPCPVAHVDRVLRETWSPAGALVLGGPKTWSQPSFADGIVIDDRVRERAPAGDVRFVPARGAKTP